MASSFPEEPLLPLLWAVRLLLLGVNMYLVGCQGRCNCEPIEKWPPKLNKR